MVREKLFALPPISMQDALVALQLIDHPFYLFRNNVPIIYKVVWLLLFCCLIFDAMYWLQVSNEINLVYRREGGGVGLIAPAGVGEDADARQQ